MAINTRHYDRFRVGDYFSGTRGRTSHLQSLAEGETPVIAAAAYNQGIAGLYNVKPEYSHRITVSCNGAGCGSCFFHDYDFAMNGDAIVLEPLHKMSDYVQMYITSVLNAFLRIKYSYTEKCSADKCEAEYISLPVTADGEPDYRYMEDYMKAVETQAKNNLDLLSKVNEESVPLDVSKWKKFPINKYFDVIKGTRLTKANMHGGNIRFIGASAMDNGITKYISNNEKLHNPHVLTVAYNGSVGETFYQDEHFWASDDVNVLYPKIEMSWYTMQFIGTIIKTVGKLYYEFVDKWKLDDMKKQQILLPVTESGEPDWQYMEMYMKKMEKKAKNNIDALKKVGEQNA